MDLVKDRQRAVLWVRLQEILGYNAAASAILDNFTCIEDIFSCGEQELYQAGFSKSQLQRFRENTPERSEHIVNVCLNNGWDILTPDLSDYPDLLLKLRDYPVVLYVSGNRKCLDDRFFVAMVGTRHPSHDSTVIAISLSASLTRSGAAIVSGGALGIDSASHEGALSENGTTIAVMGCGLDRTYPSENEGLRRRIEKKGAAVSEFPPGMPPLAKNFPARNRIISGLSYATVVVEANERSGSLITARFAREQGRGVFAVSGNPLTGAYSGANKLISAGADPVYTANDILGGYTRKFPSLLDERKIEKTLVPAGGLYPSDKGYKQGAYERRSPAQRPSEKTQAAANAKKESAKKEKQTLPPGLSEAAARIYGFIDDKTVSEDDIVNGTGLGIPQVLSALTELELYSLIKTQDAGMVSRA